MPLNLIVYAVCGASVVAFITFIHYHGRSVGYEKCQLEVTRTNAAAEGRAREAVDALRRLCARDPRGCLLDQWTRDNVQ